MLALKLRHARTAAEPLVEAMVLAARRARLDADLVTWVPARRRDKRQRGFDHAEVLARGVARTLGLPAVQLLERIGVQADQVGLDRASRLSNLSGAFAARRGFAGAVLLVDDLVTTGATARSCAACLLSGGASSVQLVAACRA